MPGVKLHHPVLRNAMLVAEDPDRPYPVPYICTACDRVHINKAVHLRFDGVGDVCVAEEAWGNMKHLFPELKEMGYVAQPEPMTLGMNGKSETYWVVRQEDSHG